MSEGSRPVIYEVNIKLLPRDRDDYSNLVKDHMGKLLALPGFVHAYWYERHALDEGEIEDQYLRWTIHYHVCDRKSLEQYFLTLAPSLRAEALRFSGRVQVSRRILEVIQGD